MNFLYLSSIQQAIYLSHLSSIQQTVYISDLSSTIKLSILLNLSTIQQAVYLSDLSSNPANCLPTRIFSSLNLLMLVSRPSNYTGQDKEMGREGGCNLNWHSTASFCNLSAGNSASKYLTYHVLHILLQLPILQKVFL